MAKRKLYYGGESAHQNQWTDGWLETPMASLPVIRRHELSTYQHHTLKLAIRKVENLKKKCF